MGLTLPAVPALFNSSDVTFEPNDAWVASNIDANCTTNDLTYTTSLINSTVSFNYSGPSVEIHIISSPFGGIFSIVVDGFNTTSVIDTYADSDNDGAATNTVCFPFRFPPFAITPTDYGSRNDHTISLVFVGQSPDAGPLFNASQAVGRINGFAIPELSGMVNDAIGYSNAPCTAFQIIMMVVLFVMAF
jgi:hypothetical protein